MFVIISSKKIKRYNFNICKINLKYNYFYNNGLFI